MNGYEELVSWMNANPNLSGWAQAVGAGLALVVAILIPAIQRWAERRDSIIAVADQDAAQALGVYYLLADLRNFLQGHIARADLARGMTADHVVMQDFLSRVAGLEAREAGPDRLSPLYLCRGTITLVRLTFAPWLAAKPLAPEDVKLIAERLNLVNAQLLAASSEMDEAIWRSHMVKTAFTTRQIMRLRRRLRKRRSVP